MKHKRRTQKAVSVFLTFVYVLFLLAPATTFAGQNYSTLTDTEPVPVSNSIEHNSAPPPVTTANIALTDGTSVPNGFNGWWVDFPQIKLVSDPNDCLSYYNWDDNEFGWDLLLPIKALEGSHKFGYYSWKNKNRIETPQYVTIKVDTLKPSGAININDNASVTTSEDVTVNITAADQDSGVWQMMVSDNQSFTGASWEPYSPAKVFTLSNGDGIKNVYTKFRDFAGNESDTYSASIVLDQSIPTISGVENGGIYNTTVYPVFSEGPATLNGKDFVSGTPVSDEGTYTLEVTDPAKHLTTATFTIDKTPPTVDGVINGGVYKNTTATFYEGTALLNGTPYESGTPITKEGQYELVVSDGAGNNTTIDFSLDTTAPGVGGVAEGGFYCAASATFSEGSATLNGTPYASGALITEDGTYTLVVSDSVGNENIIHFTVDSQAPAVVGVVEGGVYRNTKAMFEEGTATLNGLPYNSGELIDSEGTYTIVVKDEAGNATTVHFSIDTTPPQVSGVTDGEVYQTVTATFTEGTATLNGNAYISGTTISAEGSYELVVTDTVGNASTIRFFIDKTPPTVQGVIDGGIYKSVSASFNEGTAILNNVPYESGTPVTKEGSYQLVVTDFVGNATVVNFTIDTTPPVITNVLDGQTYKQAVTPLFSEGTGLLNQKPFVSGTEIKDIGSYQLIVTDAAGNVSTVNFNIVSSGPELTITSPQDNLTVSQMVVLVSGKVNDLNSIVKVNGLRVYPDVNGDFSKQINLQLGNNTITITATDALGYTTTETRTVVAPFVTVTSPVDNSLTKNETVTVVGKVAVGYVPKVQGSDAQVDSQGNFAVPVTLVNEGVNTITVTAGETTVARQVIYDKTPPNLSVVIPEVVDQPQVVVSGKVDTPSSVKINGSLVYPDSNGNFTKTIQLNLGKNEVTVTATDPAGNSTEQKYLVTAPYITVTSPTNNLLTNAHSVLVTGKVALGTSLSINAQTVTADSVTGDFNYPVAVTEGTNTITVVANSTTITRTIIADFTGPSLDVQVPSTVDQTNVTITGTVEKGCSVKVNNITVYPDVLGKFSKNISLNLGVNKLIVLATDPSGNQTSKEYQVTAPYVSVDSPVDGSLTNKTPLVVTGKVAVGASLTVNGYNVTPNSDGSFSQPIDLAEGTNNVTVMAGTTTIGRTVVYDSLPPVLSVTLPANVDQLSVIASGNVEKGSTLKVGNISIYPDADGNFSKTISLALGENTLKFIATDPAGNVTTKDCSVVAPYVTVDTPAEGLLTNSTSLRVAGKAIPGSDVTVNGKVLTTDTTGMYSASVDLTEGTNAIVVSSGQTTVTRNVICDLTLPALTLNVPETVDQPAVTVTGNIEKGCTLKVNGTSIYPDASGNFSKTLSMSLGANTLTFVATDPAGNVLTENRTVTGPYVVVSSPSDNLLTNTKSITISGKVAANTNLMINQQNVAVTNGNFSTLFDLSEGKNIITIQAGPTTITKIVNLDTSVPNLSVTAPVDGTKTPDYQVTVTGTAEPGSTVKVNGSAVYPDANGNFSKNLSLTMGSNIITITATDAAGNVASETRTVVTPLVIVNSPVDNTSTNKNLISIIGKAAVGSNVQVNGTPVSLDSNNNFSTEITLNPGLNTITVIASDNLGNSTTVTRQVNYDTNIPVITITSPAQNTVLSTNQVTVTGTVTPGCTVKINGTNVYPDSAGNFSKALTLSLGDNVITITATNSAGTTTTESLKVIAPLVSVSTPADNFLTNKLTVTVTGKVATNAVLTVNGNPVIADSQGNYTYDVSLTPDTINPITISATDSDGHNTTVNRTVKCDRTAPVLSLTSPVENATTTQTQVTVTGQVEVGSTLKINGSSVYPDSAGNFSKTLTLSLGKNTITIVATDAAGNSSTIIRTVYAPFVTVNAPVDNMVTNKEVITVSGKAAIGSNVSVNNNLVTVDAGGNFSTTVTLATGQNIITIFASSPDNSVPGTTITRSVTYDNTPPALTITSPQDSAQLDQTQVTVTGNVEVGSTLKINGSSVYPDTLGNFSKVLTLAMGSNVITIIATDQAGNATTVTRTVVAPLVTVSSPSNNVYTNSTTITVTGKAVLKSTVTINGNQVVLDTNGNFAQEILLSEGDNLITVTATDESNNTTTVTRTITCDTKPPTLTLNPVGSTTTLTQVTISGIVETGCTVKVNGLQAYPDSAGNFSKTVSLALGSNTISVVATDKAGNTTTSTFIITRT